VLFADVRLRRNDDSARLAELGVALSGGPLQARFRQPCSCLQGGSCRIYADRPERCRTFECRLLQRTLQGKVSERSALRAIADAKRRAQAVREILRELGDTDESLPLSRRYQRMMRQPIDLAGSHRAVRLRGKLMLAVAELTRALERDFLS
jgi:Fe-S-cluster containining protein